MSNQNTVLQSARLQPTFASHHRAEPWWLRYGWGIGCFIWNGKTCVCSIAWFPSHWKSALQNHLVFGHLCSIPCCAGLACRSQNVYRAQYRGERSHVASFLHIFPTKHFHFHHTSSEEGFLCSLKWKAHSQDGCWMNVTAAAVVTFFILVR